MSKYNAKLPKHNRLTILAAMHGDEVYGIELYQRFVEYYPQLGQYIKLIIGNQVAKDRNTRYIDEDMNRAYGSKFVSHEKTEIERVEREIKEFDPVYIIDIHTTRRDSGVFYISGEVNSIRQRIFDMLDIDVCIMNDPVIERSFIGNHSNAVSLEYSLRDITADTTRQFVEASTKLINGVNSSLHNSRLYGAKSLITRREWSRYPGLQTYDKKSEGIALMVPADEGEMDAEYYGFWCDKSPKIPNYPRS